MYKLLSTIFLLLITSLYYVSSIASPLPSEPNANIYTLAEKVYQNALKQGIKVNQQLVTFIDYSLPSNQKRLWIIDLDHHNVIYNTYVAHGKYSGDNYASNFSDRPDSHETSIGVYLTKNTYYGHDGLSLVLQGLDKGFNDQAESRRIVMHGAKYVSEAIANTQGHIGRSWGCPAVDQKLAAPIINTIKEGTILIAYYPDKGWLQNSTYLA